MRRRQPERAAWASRSRATWASTCCSSTCTRRSRRRTAAAARAPGRSAVRDVLAPYLPVPRLVRDGDAAALERGRPAERSAACAPSTATSACWCAPTPTSRALGGDGLDARRRGMAVLNANYICARACEGTYQLAVRRAVACTSACSPTRRSSRTASRRSTSPSACSTTASTRRRSTSRWSCSGALMIEPTETESKETLDEFVDAMLAIAEEARSDPDAGPDGAAPHAGRRASTRRAPRGGRCCAGARRSASAST